MLHRARARARPAAIIYLSSMISSTTLRLVREATASVLEKLKAQVGEEKFNSGKLPMAGKILVELMTSPNFHEFLTTDAYAYLA